MDLRDRLVLPDHLDLLGSLELLDSLDSLDLLDLLAKPDLPALQVRQVPLVFLESRDRREILDARGMLGNQVQQASLDTLEKVV